MSFVGKIFRNKKPKHITIGDFIKDVETKIESLSLSDKTIGTIEKRVRDLELTLRALSSRIEEFSKERKEMDEISKRVIELVSLIYTMDTKINNLSKQIYDMKNEIENPRHVNAPKPKKRKDTSQIELKLKGVNHDRRSE
ncbi:MAG: hypothetical protein ABH868_06020 [bacterium]